MELHIADNYNLDYYVCKVFSDGLFGGRKVLSETSPTFYGVFSGGLFGGRKVLSETSSTDSCAPSSVDGKFFPKLLKHPPHCSSPGQGLLRSLGHDKHHLKHVFLHM